MSTVTLAGTPIEVSGTFLAVNSHAPEFSLVGKDLSDITLSSFGNVRKILNIVPSLDTSVCAASARKFNQQASSLKDTVVLVISADLPFAMGRFCSVEGLDRVIPLSLMRGRKFLRDYGVDITSGPLAGAAARAVFVLDRDNTVLYSQLVPEIKQEPNYDGALAVLA